MEWLAIRNPTVSEVGRIVSKWEKIIEPPRAERDPVTGPMHRAPHYGHQIAPYVWRLGADALIERLMSGSKVLVATLTSVPDEMVGWVVYQEVEDAVRIHMVYVLGDARRKGIARALLEEAVTGRPWMVTYSTRSGRALLESTFRISSNAGSEERALV